MTVTPCFVCGSTDGEPFFEAEAVPVHCNVLARTRAEALAAPRATLRLVLCPVCGLIYNERFEPTRMRYAGGYETSLHHSGVFQEYAERLVRRLIREHDLRSKDVIEVGCGRGDFLRLVCELGANRGLGIDPGHTGLEEELPGGGRIVIVGETWAQALRERSADLVACRHVLEHLVEPVPLLAAARRATERRPDALVFFEVPDVLFTLRQGGIWDVIYEHCSYFSPASLAFACERAGLTLVCIEQVYGGQFLTIEARPGAPRDERHAAGLDELQAATRTFGDTHRAKLAAWEAAWGELRETGRRAAVWGAGSKGVTFLNAFAAAGEVVSHVVDRNPRKQGCFVPGSGQPIVAPEALGGAPPDMVIAMNPLYADEIRRELVALGIEAEVCVA